MLFHLLMLPPPTVATALNEKIFCYFGLREQLHSDLEKQFQLRLMAELCSRTY